MKIAFILPLLEEEDSPLCKDSSSILQAIECWNVRNAGFAEEIIVLKTTFEINGAEKGVFSDQINVLIDERGVEAFFVLGDPAMEVLAETLSVGRRSIPVFVLACRHCFKYENIFYLWRDAATIANIICRKIQKLHCGNVLILSDDGEYGDDYRRSFDRYRKTFDIPIRKDVLTNKSYRFGHNDDNATINNILKKIQDYGVDAIVVVGYGVGFENCINAVTKQYSGAVFFTDHFFTYKDNFEFYYPWINTNDDLVGQIKEIDVKSKISFFSDNQEIEESLKKINSLAKNNNGHEVKALSSLTFASLDVLREAAKRNLDGSRNLSEALFSLKHVETAVGPFIVQNCEGSCFQLDIESQRGLNIEIDKRSFKSYQSGDIAYLLQTIDDNVKKIDKRIVNKCVVRNQIKGELKNIFDLIFEPICRLFEIKTTYLFDNIGGGLGCDYVYGEDGAALREIINRILLSGVLEHLDDPLQVNISEDDVEQNDAVRVYVAEGDDVCPLVYYAAQKRENERLVVEGIVLARTERSALLLWKSRNRKLCAEKSGYVPVITELNMTSGRVSSRLSWVEESNIGGADGFLSYCMSLKQYVYFIPSERGGADIDQYDSYKGWLIIDLKNQEGLGLEYLPLRVLNTIVSRIFAPLHSALTLCSLEIASTKSAIGSIMSRNGSHNIGSHVLAALSHNVGTMPDDRVLYQYIQHRMDYIATATTDFPTWSSETKLVNGLMRQFLSQRHLLDYIASSEGLHAFKFQDPNISEDAEQPNTIRLRIRTLDKLDEEGNPCEFIGYKGLSATADFDDDVAVAIPGGVIGGHAFFTILENVIRNAAKHGWAKTSEKKKDYLEIYVDFKRDDSNRTIEVDVYDGLSDVFAILKKKIEPKEGEELTPEEKATNKAIEHFHAKIGKWKEGNECARKPLVTRKQNKNEDVDEEQLLADYLSGKSDALPEMYNSIRAFLSGKETISEGGRELSFKRCKLLSDILVGITNKDDELGHRLWLPLHHSQQLKLAKPFIDESGALRKENWGLAEIKISAGYINRRSISEIGGLDNVGSIITPVCEAGVDKGAHLGYHFPMPIPREIAFVCDTKKIDPNKITELRSYGVYVVNSPKDDQYVKPKNKGDEDWNYSYVVLPKFPAQKDPHLPFRVLARDRNTTRADKRHARRLDMVPSAASFYDAIKKLTEGDATAKDIADALKNRVYDKWREYWYSTRRNLGINNIPKLEVSVQRKGGDRDKNNGESSRVYNIDVWRFVVRELFRSIVGHFLSDAQAEFGEASKEVLAFLELMAIAHKNDAKTPFFSFLGSEILIGQINKQKTISDKLLCELLLKEFLGWFSSVEQDCKGPGGVQYSARLKKFREDYSLPPRKSVSELIEHAKRIRELAQSEKCNYDYNDQNPLFVDDEGYDNGLLGFIHRMLNGYREADVMLRKYEERILTLPVIFTENEGKDNSKVHSQGSGKRIVYERHAGVDDFLPDQMLYQESLSGTQSYIYDLIQYQNKTGSQKISTKLYENGLARVVIIDERVSKFLRDRPEMIKTFCHMGIWCVDETNFSDHGSNFHNAIDSLETFGSLLVLDKAQIDEFINSLKNESSTSDGETGKKSDEKGRKVFDVLIIHQGIIDKWLSHAGADSKKVEEFIERLKEEIPYVVITTGRGTPANIPDSARILPFSIIEATLFKKHPEKLVLVDTIMSILPIGEHQ